MSILSSVITDPQQALHPLGVIVASWAASSNFEPANIFGLVKNLPIF